MPRGAIRRPAVAGYFYPADPAILRGRLNALMPATEPGTPPTGGVGDGSAEGRSPRPTEPAAARAVVVPHGSYERCGALTGWALGGVPIPRRCIVVGPSHTGSWMPWSLLTDGAYRTPLGDVPVDRTASEALLTRCPFLQPDAWAQRGEHAVEVVLPFLQHRGPDDLAVVPIITGSDDAGEFVRLAEALAQVVRLLEEPVLLIASSDLSHYEPLSQAVEQDAVLLAHIEALDGWGLIRYVQDHPVTMCGYGAVACVVEAAKSLGASRAAVGGHRTSAEAGGDPESVIGYASVILR